MMASPFGRKSAKQAIQTGRITAFPTVLRSLRETDADLTDILDAIADGVIVRNAQRKMLYANEAAARLLGYPTIAAIMSTPNEEFDSRFEFADEQGDPVETSELPSRRALRGSPCPEITLRYRNQVTGATGWALVKSRPVLDAQGNVRLTVTIIHDITELKQAEADLRQARDELERTNEEQTTKLFEANAELRERLAQQEQGALGLKSVLHRVFRRTDGAEAAEGIAFFSTDRERP
jgi:PAS domain S-box-containing protein